MKYLSTFIFGIFLPFFSIAQCDQPFGLTAENITSTSADLTWDNSSGAVYWSLEWGLDGFIIGEGNYIDSVDITYFQLLDLNPETSYDFFVWAICADDTSTAAGFEFMTFPGNNQTCDADTVIVDGATVLVNNINAITSGPQATCWGNHIDGDLWYLFVLDEPMGIEILTSPGTSNDSHIALYEVSGCDDEPSYDQLYCSEDISGSNWMSYIITEELAPGTYYIQCGTWTNSSGSYELEVKAVVPIILPPNNECENASVTEVIVDGPVVSVSGNGTDATDENMMGVAHVWEAFTLDACADVSLDFCGSSPVPVIIFNSLFNSCDIGNIFQNGSIDTDLCVDGNQAMNYTSLPAGTYYYPIIADENLGGFEDYTLNITAVTCAIIPQPDTCLTWMNGPWGDFNSEFGGAPFPDTNGICPVYTLDIFSIWASESYEILNFQNGIEYTVSVCDGEGAGSWPVEIAILDSNMAIIAWDEACEISFVAPYNGTLFIGFNEAGACGESSTNTQTDNGYLSITCGGVAIGIEEIIKPQFSIYPNPSKGMINIQNLSGEGDFKIELISISGKSVWNKNLSLSLNDVQSITLPEITSGLYLIKLINVKDQSISVQRLIIE